MVKTGKEPPKKQQNRKEQSKLGLFARIKKFLREVRNELRKVNWPSRKELMAYTGVVLVTVLIVSTFIGVVDLVFSQIISALILR